MDWYVRKGGSDSNGGSSSSTTADRSGSDMSTTNGSTQVTSVSATFAAGDVGKGINISGVIYRIATFTNSTTIQLERNYAGTTGSNRTWAIGGALLTVGKLLIGAVGAVLQGGDTLWIGAGTYRETISFGLTSPGSELAIVGDVDGTSTGDAGAVVITGFTTSDFVAGSATCVLTLGGVDNLHFKNIWFISGGNPSTATCVDATTTTSTGIKFTDCTFFNGTGSQKKHMTITAAFNVALNWTITRCLFVGATSQAANANFITVTCTTGVGADYNVNFAINDTIFLGAGSSSSAIFVTNSGTAANKGNGVKCKNCTFWGIGAISITATQVSTTQPSTFMGCLIYSGGFAALFAGTSGQITEDYNLIVSATPRTNVTTGGNSQTAYAPLVHFGQERKWGAFLRHLLEPISGSPLLNFGSDGTGTATDFRNNPRPAGGAGALAAVGALERANTWVKETSTVRTGSNALSCVGPGYQDFLVPVDAVSTTIAVYMRYDSTYAGTKPRIQVLNGTECGVADATSSAVTTVDTWEQLSLTFTPTSKGIVTIRLLSVDTNGAGKTFADDFSVT